MRVDATQIHAGLRIAAQLVARDGEAYLPIFLALEAEAEAISGRNSALDRAAALIGGGRLNAA